MTQHSGLASNQSNNSSYLGRRHTSHRGRRIVTTSISLALLATASTIAPANAAPANTQLPGASASGDVVITDSPHITVSVAPHNAADDVVSVTIKNNYDHNFECYAPGVSTDETKPTKLPNVVTEAEIVKKSIDYYRQAPHVPNDGVNVPLLGVIPTNQYLEHIPSGIFGKIFGSDIALRAALFRDWDRAKLAGHTGDLAPFNLNGWQEQEFKVTLNSPGNGARSEFDAAALVYCKDVTAQPNQSYVFAGYETGKEPATSDPFGSLGSPALPAANSARR